MTKDQEYVMVLHKLKITRKLLMSTVQDLDRVKNREVRNDYDKDMIYGMLTWLLSIRTPIEDEMNKLETYRSELKKSL